MATKKKTLLEEERMTDANIRRVISLLEPEEGKPITKKEACDILGMAYNTTRLGKLIEEFKAKEAKEKVRRAEKRGKPFLPEEIDFVVSEYLIGETIDSISKATYRSAASVKNVLVQHEVPIRAASHDYFKPSLIPEGASRDRFTPGEVVYSARYDSLATIEAEYTKSEEHGFVYRIWLLSEKWKQYAYQPAYEIASLQHLRDRGIRV